METRRGEASTNSQNAPAASTAHDANKAREAAGTTNDSNKAREAPGTHESNKARAAPGTNESPALYRDPSLYDAIYEPFIADISLYRELALEAAGPVVELACGSGRVTVPLARAGVPIVGIDLSPAMVAAARERAMRENVANPENAAMRENAASPENAAMRAWFLPGDMRDPIAAWEGIDRGAGVGRRPVVSEGRGGRTEEISGTGIPRPGTFRLAIIPLHSLSHLVEPGDALRCLQNLRTLLVPDGRLVLAVHNPVPELLERDPEALYPVEMPRPLLESSRYDRDRRVLHVRWWVERAEIQPEREEEAGRDADTDPGPELYEFDLRIFSPRELDALLESAGFELRARWGWYDRSSFTGESGTQVVVAASGG